MKIKLTNADENYIKSEVQKGIYTNETELIRDALQRMREEKERSERFKAAVLEGAADIEAGRTTPLTLELMHELVQSGISRAQKGLPTHSNDAIPEKSDNQKNA